MLFDRLIELGAIDAELAGGDGIAALMPDNVTPEQISRALGVSHVAVSAAIGRDENSVWILSQRPIQVGRLRLVPAHGDVEPNTIKLVDTTAFGTGLHPTTAMCLEVLDEAVQHVPPDAVLDVGIGSGVLALAALLLGVPRATGLDIDDDALRVAAENARLNGMDGRLQLTRGGPDAVSGTWPLVLANVLAAPLIEMAPALVRRVGHAGARPLRDSRIGRTGCGPGVPPFRHATGPRGVACGLGGAGAARVLVKRAKELGSGDLSGGHPPRPRDHSTALIVQMFDRNARSGIAASGPCQDDTARRHR